MYESLRGTCEPRRCAIEDAAAVDLNDSDTLIIGTPVCYAAPSRIVTDYFHGIRPFEKQTPAFLYNTCATWSCDTNRILAKQVQAKNFITIMDRDYRSPNSGGSLIAPFVQRFFEFQKDLSEQVLIDSKKFMLLLSSGGTQSYVPRFRFASAINAPNKLAGQLITFPAHNHRDRCLRCGTCVKNCPHQTMAADDDGYPIWNAERCENHYRRIHHCLGKTRALSKRRARKTPQALMAHLVSRYEWPQKKDDGLHCSMLGKEQYHAEIVRFACILKRVQTLSLSAPSMFHIDPSPQWQAYT